MVAVNEQKRAAMYEEFQREDRAVRFWSKIQKTKSCWNWTGAQSGGGYGVVSILFKGQPRNFYAHRVAYVLTAGSIPKEQYVLHTCDNKLCCNPSHLFIGVAIDNTKDMIGKGRYVRPRIPTVLTERLVVKARREYKALPRYSNGHVKNGFLKKLSKKYEIKKDTLFAIVTGRNCRHMGW